MKYLGAFSLGLRGALQYRLSFFVSLLGALSPVVVQIALWTRLYPSKATNGAAVAGGAVRLFGFSFADMLGYVVIANIVSCLVRTGFEYQLNEDIRTGGLDRHLVKPIDYFGFRAAQFLGGKAAESVFLALSLVVALGFLAGAAGFVVSAGSVLGFIVALGLALTLNFLVFWCVGLIGFWLTEIGFLFEAARIVIVTASGGIFPLAALGTRAEAVLSVMPFRFTIQFPTNVLCGRVAAGEFAHDLVVGALWCLALAILGRVLWAAGLRRFVAVGG